MIVDPARQQRAPNTSLRKKLLALAVALPFLFLLTSHGANLKAPAIERNSPQVASQQQSDSLRSASSGASKSRTIPEAPLSSADRASSALISRVLVKDCVARANSPTPRVWTTVVRNAPRPGLIYNAVTSADVVNGISYIRIEAPVSVMSLFKRPAVLLDVGANVGRVAFPVMRMKMEHRVVAVEPVKGNVDTLCRSAVLNGWGASDRLTFVQAALSHKPGEMEIFVPKGRGDNAAISRGAAVLNVKGPAKREIIRVVGGDALLQELKVSPDVIKIDTQGHELSVLRGLKQYLASARDVLVIAESDLRLMAKSSVNPKDIYRLMVKELGYQVYSRPRVAVVDGVIRLHGSPITESRYPPRRVEDLYFIKPSTPNSGQ